MTHGSLYSQFGSKERLVEGALAACESPESLIAAAQCRSFGLDIVDFRLCNDDGTYEGSASVAGVRLWTGTLGPYCGEGKIGGAPPTMLVLGSPISVPRGRRWPR